MATKLTDEEKEEMDEMQDDDLRVTIEEAVRKRRRVMDDKSAYAKACNDLIKLQEARMDYAVEVLDKRAIERGEKAAPAPAPPTPPAPSAGPPPPPPVTH